MTDLLIATSNPGKVRGITTLLHGLPHTLRTPNDLALRLVSAVLMEIDENWQVGRKYLRFEEEEKASPSS